MFAALTAHVNRSVRPQDKDVRSAARTASHPTGTDQIGMSASVSFISRQAKKLDPRANDNEEHEGHTSGDDPVEDQLWVHAAEDVTPLRRLC